MGHNVRELAHMNHTDDVIYETHAEMCRIFTHAARLKIIDLLGRGEMSVNALTRAVGINRTTVSQHLAVLREQGVVRTKRKGTTIYYRISDHRIITACLTMRAVLLDRMKAAGDIASAARRAQTRRRK